MTAIDKRLFLLVSAVLCLCLAACGEGSVTSSTPASVVPTPTPLPTRTPLPGPIVAGQLLPPAGSIYFGAYVDTSGLSGGNTPADTSLLESQMGRTLALHMYYQSFLTNFGNRAVQDDYNNGRVPIDSWNCGATNVTVAAGAQDAEIKLKADDIRTYAWPVFVRFFWDMNLPSTNLSRTACFDPKTDIRPSQFSPTEFIAAWQHVHSIFQQEGATNAIFVWSVDALGVDPMQYYPGDAYVDWVGLDDYDTGNTDFASTFAPMYTELATLNKPIMIAETGALSTQQQTFFQQAVPALKSQFPQVQALVYYDAVYYASSTLENQDWRIAPSAFPAFTAFANDPYMAAMYVH